MVGYDLKSILPFASTDIRERGLGFYFNLVNARSG